MSTSKEFLSSCWTWTISGLGFSVRTNIKSNISESNKRHSVWTDSWDSGLLCWSGLQAYPGRWWWTRTSWSSGWCNLRGRAGWGLFQVKRRCTPEGTPAAAPPPSRTPAEGWAGGSQNAAGETMKTGSRSTKIIIFFFKCWRIWLHDSHPFIWKTLKQTLLLLLWDLYPWF